MVWYICTNKGHLHVDVAFYDAISGSVVIERVKEKPMGSLLKQHVVRLEPDKPACLKKGGKMFIAAAVVRLKLLMVLVPCHFWVVVRSRGEAEDHVTQLGRQSVEERPLNLNVGFG